MQNKEKSQIVPSPKDLLNLIVSSDDIREAAKTLNVDTKKIYNVLNDSNKRDLRIVLKVLKKTIQKRIKKEQLILDRVVFLKEKN